VHSHAGYEHRNVHSHASYEPCAHHDHNMATRIHANAHESWIHAAGNKGSSLLTTSFRMVCNDITDACNHPRWFQNNVNACD
jgi:hypothetical protein